MSEDINQASLFYIRYILSCLICNLYLVNFFDSTIFLFCYHLLCILLQFMTWNENIFGNILFMYKCKNTRIINILPYSIQFLHFISIDHILVQFVPLIHFRLLEHQYHTKNTWYVIQKRTSTQKRFLTQSNDLMLVMTILLYQNAFIPSFC